MRRSGRYSESDMNRVSVATELQADFYAGLWAKQTDNRENFLILKIFRVLWNFAAAVGDDNIQKERRVM